MQAALIFLLLLLLLPVQARELETVGHPRQLRGAWVASVANLHWPSKSGLSAEQQQAELRRILDVLQKARFNAIFFQVRPEGDALYRSQLEPWSRFLSGQQGGDPGYDPLELLITEAHARNLEVHAWLNPYRAQAVPPPTGPAVAPHLSVTDPELVFDYGKLKWMDPSSDVVRDRLVEVCQDLTRRYDLDGLHFDDYFYPYPEGETPFPDHPPADEPVGDWRRAQVNQAIREVRDALLAENPQLRFGISPFGIPAPEKPAQIQGLDQYARLFADTQLWMDRGWVDYLAPQLYWPHTRPAQAYDVLMQWWEEHARGGRPIFPGINLAALGTKPEWTLDEFRRQLAQAKNGYIIWNITPLLEGRQDNLFDQPLALTPPIPRRRDQKVAPPEVHRNGPTIHIRHPDRVRAWTIYREGELQQVVPGTAAEIQLPRGRWAIAAVARDGCESQGVVVR